MLTEAFSVGVIERLDYWSDYLAMDGTDFKDGAEDDASNNSVASDDLLTLSIGARVSVIFG